VEWRQRVQFPQPCSSGCLRCEFRSSNNCIFNTRIHPASFDMASSAPPTLYGLGSIPEQLYGVAISLLVITWTAALARAYVRVCMLRSVGWDDWTLIPAQICYTVQCAFMISMARMEMEPDANSSIRNISQLVTVSKYNVRRL
jgi:hypothetical protein